MKQQFLKEKSGTIQLSVYDSNRAIVPDSAKITLYTASGGTLQAQADASVDSTTGEMTYSLTTTHTADHDLNYKAIWEYVYNGTTYYETQLFDVVKSILSIPITDDDLYAELGTLRDTNEQVQGTASGGGAAYIDDTTSRKEENDYWKGGRIEIISGTGVNQKRDVTGFTQSTSRLAVSPDWTTTPDTTSIYRLVKSFYAKINQCFEEIETMIYNKGKRHSLILESSQIKYPLLYLTIHKICQDNADEAEDKWDRLAIRYMEKFDKAFDTMTVEYDEDESGTIDLDEETHHPSEVRIFRT